jgi:hypothetical protein
MKIQKLKWEVEVVERNRLRRIRNREKREGSPFSEESEEESDESAEETQEESILLRTHFEPRRKEATSGGAIEEGRSSQATYRTNQEAEVDTIKVCKEEELQTRTTSSKQREAPKEEVESRYPRSTEVQADIGQLLSVSRLDYCSDDPCLAALLIFPFGSARFGHLANFRRAIRHISRAFHHILRLCATARVHRSPSQWIGESQLVQDELSVVGVSVRQERARKVPFQDYRKVGRRRSMAP